MKTKKVKKHLPEVVETTKRISNALIEGNVDFTLDRAGKNRPIIAVKEKWVMINRKKEMELWESCEKYFGYDCEDEDACFDSLTSDIDVAIKWLLTPYCR